MKILALDVDGVLTDGISYRGEQGFELKAVRFRDVDAVHRWKRSGGLVALLTGEDSPLIDEFGEWLGCGWVLKGVKAKRAGLNRLVELSGIPAQEICYVGDGDRDAGALEDAGLGFAPSDASPAAKAAATTILSMPGGGECIREAVDLLMGMTKVNAVGPDSAAAPTPGSLPPPSAEFVDPYIARVELALQESARTLEATSKALTTEICCAARMIADSIRAGGKLLVAGNGGSASQAQHFVGELVGRFLLERQGYPAIALTADSSVMTAIGNDYAFDEVFSRQVKALGKPGDVFVGISTSGNSGNVVRAVAAASENKLSVIGLTGSPGGRLADVAPFCIMVPHTSTPRIQECHIAIIHSICEVVEALLES